MITLEEERYILKNARVPEHIPGLMIGVSRAEFFLIDPFVALAKENWLIFVGYPLQGDFHEASFNRDLQRAMTQFKPARTLFIAPQIPTSIPGVVRQRESDDYYRIDLKVHKPKRNLIRIYQKAAENLSVAKSNNFSQEHELLTREFLQRQKLSPRVHELYLRMKDYIAFSPTSLLLSARDRENRLSAYYVLELGAEKFLTYVVGCYSKTHYAPHATDLLFHEMIEVAREHQKEYIHLGLGVNQGVSRFKKKWGGVPFLKYEFGEISSRSGSPFFWIKAFMSRL